MFQHLFQGSPPLVMAALMIGVTLHIGAGGVAILAGAGALIARKGGHLHQQFGTTFFISMLVMATVAAALAMAAVSRGHLEQIANVFAGAFAVYLVSTGWLTVKRDAGAIGFTEVVACVGVLAIAAVALLWLLPLSRSLEGRAEGVPAAAPIILAAVAALLAGSDIKVLLNRGVVGVSRLRRHLWRMCLGLFIATGSFFIGQQKDMPAVVQGSPLLLLLGVAPLIVMIAWLFAVRKRARRPASADVSKERALPSF